MRVKRFVLLLLFACCIQAAKAQSTGAIKGQLTDTTEHKDLTNALVTVMNAADSSLAGFTRTSKDGAFQVSGLDTGRYVIMITHPYFADVFENTALAANAVSDLKTIHLLSRIKLMEEVIVKGNRAIFMSGDTTVFTADSFKVAEGANVEELLKKLPGFQVDKDGKITALGKTVERVLVDGEEFFGSDPGIATKNLRADNIKEVQVYEGKSDQAAFTGIDDGKSKQTLNLKLKEDKKKGYFGKIELGGGLKDKSETGGANKFNNSVMLNAFKAKRKIAAYGIMSNTGMLNLNWDDQEKYGGDNDNMQVSDDGSVMMYFGGGDNWSDGIPTNWNAGFHYSNKFREDKLGLNTGYKFVKINAPSYTRSNSILFAPDSTWRNNSVSNSFSSNTRHRMNLMVEDKIDSMNTVRIRANGNKGLLETDGNQYTENLTEAGRFITRSEARSSDKTNNGGIDANVLWTHKFKKQYRTFSATAGINYSSSENNGYQYSKADFFKTLGDVPDSTALIDQQRTNTNEAKSVNARVAYTEPIIKDFYLEFSYAFSKSNSARKRSSYDKGSSGNYDQLNGLYSNDFEFNNTSNAPGVNFRVNKKKYNYSFGSSVNFNQYERINHTDNSSNPYHFTNYYPRANFNYKLKPSESVYGGYNGSANAPSLDMLQPVVDNTDQLNLRVGNPDLKPSFRHSFNMGYNSWKMLTQRNIYVYMSYSFTQNAFASLNDYTSLVRKYQTVNANGVSNLYAYLGYGFKLKKADIQFNINPGINGGRSVEFIRNSNSSSPVQNTTTRNTYELGFSVRKAIQDQKFVIWIRPEAGYNNTRATVNTRVNQKYWSYGINGDVTAKITKDFELRTDVNGTYRQKTPDFANNVNFTIWNASAIKRFHKNEFELWFRVNDILNQKTGYNRYGFTETYRTVLKRFYLLSFVWNLNSNKTPSPAK
ncbi:TonB-dependent receptor [Niabella drilacis]|uniref:Carboxypeptidase regulatory-like domain-containing protein n=1 Tax=Niabella drilacis (strain DSM 25811 / CCM 8410 / CCUG 62505 / LMG 26954 / E90) TaxID=1285928 RepID=A0A1G6LPJ4_NIADE|nr:TonB-dependent receptor [Niabella drilacis]SDC45192.1 Carboxypeptidase regulatory-like domain-containing protein [Niabella drilacis]